MASGFSSSWDFSDPEIRLQFELPYNILEFYNVQQGSNEMIEFFCPILEHFCPLFINCPDGSHFAQMGSHFAQNTTTNPCSLLSQSQTPFADMYIHETLQTSPQNTPFPGLKSKVCKMNYSLFKMDPNWAKCLKSGPNLSRSGQKHFIHLNEAVIEASTVISGMWFSHPIS